MTIKEKTIIFSLISLVIILVFVVFGIYPQLKGIKKSSEELIDVKKELISFQNKVKELERFPKIYQELEPDLKKIDSLFVDPEVPIDLIKFWETTAQTSILSIEISPAIIKPQEDDLWKSMGFQMVLIGPFPNFLRFLEKIETAPYLIEVQNLVINKTEIGQTDVKATLLTKVFTK